MNTKDKVALIIQRSVSESEDNLYRAERQFEGMGSNQMKQPYGQSGQTCQEVLDRYKNTNADYLNCLEWVRTREG